MEIANNLMPPTQQGESMEIIQALLLKKAIKAEESQQLTLLESVAEAPAASAGQSPVGRYLNVHA